MTGMKILRFVIVPVFLQLCFAFGTSYLWLVWWIGVDQSSLPDGPLGPPGFIQWSLGLLVLCLMFVLITPLSLGRYIYRHGVSWYVAAVISIGLAVASLYCVAFAPSYVYQLRW
jgi:hypothetical protein